MDINICTAPELSNYLLHHRFNNNKIECIKFIEICLQNLNNSAPHGGENAPDSTADNLLAQHPSISALSPRGKLDISFTDSTLMLTNKSISLKLNYDADVKLFIVEDFKKKYLLLVNLNEENKFVYHRNYKVSEINNICIEYLDKVYNDICNYFTKINTANGNKIIQVGDKKETIDCYYKKNMGKLIVMTEGLFFYKPPFFIHHDAVSAGEGYAWSGGSSRFVDLLVQDKSGRKHEFSQIPRDSASVIKQKLVSAIDTVSSSEQDQGGVNVTNSYHGKQTVTPSEDDENVNENDDVAKSLKRKRSSRKSAMTSRQETKLQLQNLAFDDDNESSEDENYGGGGGNKSSSDSSSGEELDSESEDASSCNEEANAETETESEDDSGKDKEAFLPKTRDTEQNGASKPINNVTASRQSNSESEQSKKFFEIFKKK